MCFFCSSRETVKERKATKMFHYLWCSNVWRNLRNQSKWRPPLNSGSDKTEADTLWAIVEWFIGRSINSWASSHPAVENWNANRSSWLFRYALMTHALHIGTSCQWKHVVMRKRDRYRFFNDYVEISVNERIFMLENVFITREAHKVFWSGTTTW